MSYVLPLALMVVFIVAILVDGSSRKKILAWIKRWNEERKIQRHEEEMRLAAERERCERNEAQLRLLITKKQFKQVYQFVEENKLISIPEFRQMDMDFRSEQKEAIIFLKNGDYKKAIAILMNLKDTPFDLGKKFADDVETAHDLKEAVEYMHTFMK